MITLTLPHGWWVINNDYPTFGDATGQLSQQKKALFFLALYYPLQFTYEQILNMLPDVVQQPFFVPWQKVSGLGTDIMRGIPNEKIGWAIVAPRQEKAEPKDE